jgi:hypothetical protein
MIMRIELFYTYPHWFRLQWFGMLVEHTARTFQFTLYWLSGQDNHQFFICIDLRGAYGHHIMSSLL